MSCILTLDTATEYCSVALSKDGQIFSHAEHCKNQHAAKLLGMIDQVLCEANISLSALDAIGFGCGPGSFTGVRIAVSVAQGLAFGIHKPVIPISSLQIMAQTAQQQYGVSHALVALDARMGQVYYGAYALEKALLMAEIEPPQLLFPNELNIIKGQAVGNGWQVYANAFIHRERLDAIYPEVAPLAIAALPLAQAAFAQGAAIDPAQAVPIYLRDNVAQKKG